jgi:hypothetical protein
MCPFIQWKFTQYFLISADSCCILLHYVRREPMLSGPRNFGVGLIRAVAHRETETATQGADRFPVIEADGNQVTAIGCHIVEWLTAASIPLDPSAPKSFSRTGTSDVRCR